MTKTTRRSTLKGLAALPLAWSAPVVQITPLPAHAVSTCPAEILDQVVEFVEQGSTVGSFTIRNNGSAPFSVLGVSFQTTPSLGDIFIQLDPSPPVVVAPGAQVVVEVTISTDGIGCNDTTFFGQMFVEVDGCGELVVNVNGGCPSALA